jgi:plastocyanin
MSMRIRKGYFLVVIVVTLILGLCLGASATTLAIAGALRMGQQARETQIRPIPREMQHDSPANGDGPTVNVIAEDFKFSLDATEAKAGTVTFVVRNNGSMPHDFEIRGDGVSQKTHMLQPGESDSLTVDLQPGTYTYICTIPGHDQLGMQGSFTVTAGSE